MKTPKDKKDEFTHILNKISSRELVSCNIIILQELGTPMFFHKFQEQIHFGCIIKNGMCIEIRELNIYTGQSISKNLLS